jgi:hippurate hydrolase
VIFWTGASDPAAMRAGREGKAAMPPANHSPFFAPQAEPALKTGVQAMTAGALELLQK